MQSRFSKLLLIGLLVLTTPVLANTPTTVITEEERAEALDTGVKFTTAQLPVGCTSMNIINKYNGGTMYKTMTFKFTGIPSMKQQKTKGYFKLNTDTKIRIYTDKLTNSLATYMTVDYDAAMAQGAESVLMKYDQSSYVSSYLMYVINNRTYVRYYIQKGESVFIFSHDVEEGDATVGKSLIDFMNMVRSVKFYVK